MPVVGRVGRPVPLQPSRPVCGNPACGAAVVLEEPFGDGDDVMGWHACGIE
jgi:hypothetical protein